MLQVGGLGKKKKTAEAERIALLENALKMHGYHIRRLEQMLRLLDNNDLAPDQVGALTTHPLPQQRNHSDHV